MLRDIYAPTDFDSCNMDPRLSAEEKLAIIADSPISVTPCRINEGLDKVSFTVSLPFVDGASFYVGLPNFPTVLFTEHVNVGDRELYRKGIGSRLLRAAIRYAVEENENITELRTGWARLGLVNTAVSVLGIENTGVINKDIRYGWGGDRQLDELFDDKPPVDGKKYLVNGIAARIVRDRVITWEEPVYSGSE